MTLQEERRVRRVEPDLDAEQEVDFGRYGRTVARRWWLPLAGLLAGAIIGYLLSLGGGTVYRAQALVYLGQPIGPAGNAAQALNSNPATAREIVTSESVLRQVARDVGLRVGDLRRNTGATPVAGNDRRAGATGLLQITVKGKRPARVRAAANLLATILVRQVSGYSAAKLKNLQAQLAGDRVVLDSLNESLAAERLSLETKLLLQLRLAQIQQDIASVSQLMAFTRNVEAPRVAARAAAQETTARSQRNSIVVGALIGLILGTIAALAWEPFAERRRAQA
jgi:hypothetical protein